MRYPSNIKFICTSLNLSNAPYVDKDDLNLYEEDEYGDSNVYKIIERELNKNKNKTEVFQQKV